ncbi:double-stranded RNA-binding protein 1-like [Trifolium pratense]|uniref:Double-stranded RNA-binding protein 1-like n=2 Tax=Trifolium pratense TaxID=57577 RepID=A0A2K3NFS4_TRIPR|nr:double-stranded RNA-binding protein 1-like [Trifolium pratense]
MYKSKLQELCQRRQWRLPRYSFTKAGPPHNPSFKGSVSVNGVTFTSSNTFNSSKEAHNHAAMKAFLDFSSPPSGSSIPNNKYGPDPKEKVEAAKPQETQVPPQSRVILTDMDRSSKLQQQNNTRKNDLDPPVFTIKAEGPPHDIHHKAIVVIDGKSFEIPTFFNTRKEAEEGATKIVDMFQQASVVGLEFHGKASRSKKQAEHDAAQIAYIALKECGLQMYASFSSPAKENEAEKSPLESDIVKSIQKLNPEDEVLVDKEILPTNIKMNKDMPNESFPVPPNKKMKTSNMCPSSSPTERLCAKISESKTSSYQLSDRLKVYTSYPDIVFPKGITVLPIAEDKWVAVSLEFPNEKDF